MKPQTLSLGRTTWDLTGLDLGFHGALREVPGDPEPCEPGSPAASECEGLLARELWRAVRPAWAQAGWWDAELRPEVRSLMWLPVGPELMQSLVRLTDRSLRQGECRFPHHRPSVEEPIGTAGYPCACQVVIAAAWTSVASWTALQVDQSVLQATGTGSLTVPVFPSRPDLGTITDPAIEDIAPALRAGPASAQRRVAQARTLFEVGKLWRAVASGRILDWHARLLLSDLRHINEEVRDQVITQLLEKMADRDRRGLAEWTFTEMRRRAKTLTARLDRDFAQRRRASHVGRGVRVRYHGDGAGTVSADLAEDTASRVFHRLSALAQGLDDPDDSRSMDQKRADVFLDLILGQTYLGEVVPAVGTASDPGRRPPSTGEDPASDAPSGGPRPGSTVIGSGEIAVVIDLATLVGMDDTPGQVPGMGPVPASVARELAAGRRWRAWLTDSRSAGSQIVATSPGTYRPPAALARLLRAREPHCRMPGCRSMITDLDHVVPFPRGSTTVDNLQPLCRRHHRMKTHTRWRQEPTEGSTGWRWTSPTGITYEDSPEPPLTPVPPA